MSRLRRTLLGAAIGALLAMVFVPCIREGYVLFLFATDFRINTPQLILNVSFGALLGALAAHLSRRGWRRALWTTGIIAVLLGAWIGFDAFQAEMKTRANGEEQIAQFDLEHGDFEAAKGHLIKAAHYWWWTGSLESAREAKRQANDQASMEQQYAQVLQREREKQEQQEQKKREKQEARERQKQEQSKQAEAFDPEEFIRGKPFPASSDKYQHVDLRLLEPYSFTMNEDGAVDGWIRNKSSVPINAVDIHIEIKNFSGDTFASETHTVKTQIPPGRASHVFFTVSSSPARNGLSGPLSSVIAANEEKEAAERNTTTSDEHITRRFRVIDGAMVESDPKKSWTWRVQIQAAGTKQ